MISSLRTPRTRLRGIASILLLLTAVFTMSAGCAARRPAPRLGVIIVVDMLPTELFARASEHFGERGFKRLMNDGAWFTNARFSYGVTLTGPGHATIVTGTIRDVFHQFSALPPGLVRTAPIQRITDIVHDLHVRSLRRAANVVHLTHLTPLQHRVDCIDMVLHE